jgi:hypothetical protein
MTESRTLKAKPVSNRSVPLDSFADDAFPVPSEDGTAVADEVRIGRPKPSPWWIRAWQLFLLLASLWYAFLGGRGLFHQVDTPIVDFFVVVVVLWTIYHYILAPRFKWPALPLG